MTASAMLNAAWRRLAVRFGAVGLAATLTYLAVANALYTLTLAGAVVVNTVAMVAGWTVSYFGHKRFTYAITGRDERYLPRFIFVSGLLYVLSTVASDVFIDRLGVTPVIVSGAIAATCPLLSVLLHHFWSFRP